MSLILEFAIDSQDFQLGEVLSGTPQMHLELERLVPTGPMILPFIWASGESHDAFEAQVQAHPAVKEFLALDTVEDSALYRVVWHGEPTDLIEGIATADAVVPDAGGNDEWTFRLRFPDHDKLSLFHNFILEQDGRGPGRRTPRPRRDRRRPGTHRHQTAPRSTAEVGSGRIHRLRRADADGPRLRVSADGEARPRGQRGGRLMAMVMCRACGEFVNAAPEDGTFEPLRTECPACGGAAFEHYATGTMIGDDE